MNRWILSLFLCALAAHAYGQATPSARTGAQQLTVTRNPAAAGFSPERLQRLDRWIEEGIRAGRMPNLVLLVARHGQIVYHKAFGYSNRERKTPAATTDIFRIASQTKAIASVALMTLYEEGAFLLDDPVSKYIPAFANPQVLVGYDTLHPGSGPYRTRPAKSEITIRQLLTHTAGIPYGHPLEGRPEFRIPYLCSMAPDTLETVINRLARRPLVADPGTAFIYGLNTDVIGRLIEVLTGQPLDVALRERVTGPLGMNDTYFYLPAEKRGRLVELYQKERAGDSITLHPADTFRLYPVAGARTYFSAGAGMVGTALDYAKFCQMLLNGGRFNHRRILSPRTVEEMTRSQTGPLEVWDRRDPFGLGFQVISGQSRYGGLATPGAYTWGGAYCSEYTVDPEKGLVIQFFTNIMPYAHYGELTQKIRNLVYQALE
ncbi:MAG TPA: serine hydrolase domain-containing protein [Chitinophagaceae bacterium]|jgi:CubicO group peptidase (beta-lactamase class C family)|nr:serine hydrolase domain-containing protein [Chitinophagaceae bacterium]